MTVNDSTRTREYRPGLQNRLDGKGPGAPDIKTMLVILGIAAIIVFAAYFYGLSSAPIPAAQPIQTTYLENLFIDLTGNGQPDYILRAEVIINNGPLSPGLEAQP